jgi:hypothetical protein
VRWYLRAEERLPQPDVRQGDERVPVLAGTVVWLVLAGIAFLAHDDLARHDREWWAWTAVAGFALGLLGIRHMQRRHNRAAPEIGENES